MPVAPMQLRLYCPCCGNEITVSMLEGTFPHFLSVTGGNSTGFFLNYSITCEKCKHPFTYNIKNKTITFHLGR